MKIKIFIIAIVSLSILNCAMKKDEFVTISQPSNKELRVGGLYSIKSEENNFKIVKILALDKETVHIRLYKNKFQSRPQNIDSSKLSLGTIDDKEGFGIGHLPLSKEGFDNWQPIFISQEKVTDEELEGYVAWKESGGGV